VAGGLATEIDRASAIRAEDSDFDWTIRVCGLDANPPPGRVAVRGFDFEKRHERLLALRLGAFRRLRTLCCAFRDAFSCVCIRQITRIHIRQSLVVRTFDPC
jgi:hypothetical protein